MKLDLAKTNGSSPPAAFPANAPLLPILPPDQDEIWTVADVAEYLKLSPRQVWELTRRRAQTRSECPIPCLKIHSKCLRFRKSDVQKWLSVLAQKTRLQ
jgi:hypothetical protein